jgi:hypothetical protein
VTSWTWATTSMDLRWSVRHLEFSSESGNQFSDLLRPALKLKVDTSAIFFNHHEVLTGRPCFRRHIFIIHFWSWFSVVDSSSVGLAMHFRSPYAFVTVGYHTCQFFPAQFQIIKCSHVLVNKTLPVVMLVSLLKQESFSWSRKALSVSRLNIYGAVCVFVCVCVCVML